MPKRTTASTVSSAPKRRRTVGTGIGAPSADDNRSSQVSAASTGTAFCVRSVFHEVPLLTSLCARVFVSHVVDMSGDASLWENTRQWLQLLPEAMVPRLFNMLRNTCPTKLSDELIEAYFLRGPSITLTSELTGITRQTFAAVARAGPHLHTLELTGFQKHKDAAFANVLSKCHSLTVLNLSGCTQVGTSTTSAIAKHCTELATLNLNYTAVAPGALVSVLKSCSKLEVLKVAGIQSQWTDASFAKLLAGLQAAGIEHLNLKTLKLRQSALGDASIHSIVSMCRGTLSRLDISFTGIRAPAMFPDGVDLPRLEKLCITSTDVPVFPFAMILYGLPKLKYLAIGALGVGRGSNVSIMNSSAMHLDDAGLIELTAALESLPDLEHVNLVGNIKLGASKGGKFGQAMALFISKVGRRCKHLNLAGMPSVRSEHLVGLLPDNDEDSRPLLETLCLNNTSIDNDAAPFISACQSLHTLEVAGTRITNEGLFDIIDACASLERLNITSCRGVSVTDRRRIFEAWQEQRYTESNTAIDPEGA